VVVREYEPYLIAEKTIRGVSMRKAMSTGFMGVARCASRISAWPKILARFVAAMRRMSPRDDD
jgi:hypothetical protein